MSDAEILAKMECLKRFFCSLIKGKINQLPQQIVALKHLVQFNSREI